MAIGTPTRITGPHSNHATTTSSFTTGSFTPTATNLLIAVSSSESGPGTLEDAHGLLTISNSHSGSWSWTTLNQFYVPNGGTFYEQITLSYAIVPSTPGSGTITYTYNDGSAPEDRDRVIFITNVYEVSGVDTVAPVTQSIKGNATATTQTLTFGSSLAASSLAFAALGDSFSGGGFTNIVVPTNYTELNEDRADNTGSINLITAYDNASAGTSVNWTNVSGGFGSGSIAIEIKEASGGAVNRGISPGFF